MPSALPGRWAGLAGLIKAGERRIKRYIDRGDIPRPTDAELREIEELKRIRERARPYIVAISFKATRIAWLTIRCRGRRPHRRVPALRRYRRRQPRITRAGPPNDPDPKSERRSCKGTALDWISRRPPSFEGESCGVE